MERPGAIQNVTTFPRGRTGGGKGTSVWPIDLVEATRQQRYGEGV